MRRFSQVCAWALPVISAFVAYSQFTSGERRFGIFLTVVAVWSFVNACRGVPRRAARDDLLGPPQKNPNRDVVSQLVIGIVLFVWAIIWVAEVRPAKAAVGIGGAFLIGSGVLWFLLRGPLVWTQVGRDLGLEFYPTGVEDPGLYHGTVGGRTVTIAPSATGRLFRVRVTGEVDSAWGAIVDLDQWLFGMRAGPDARLRRLDELGEGTYLLVQGTRDDAVRTIRQLATAE